MTPPKTFAQVLALPIFDQDKFKKAQKHAVGVAAIRALHGLRKRTPVATGQTRGRLGFRVKGTAGGITVAEIGGKSIAPGGYNILQGLEEGTGIYGPNKTPITPKNAKFLSWVADAKPVSGSGGQRVFARSVKGLKPPRPFRTTAEQDGPAIHKALQRALIQRLNAS